jgi:hypothetical protein
LSRLVAVYGARGSVDDPFDAGAARSQQHVDEAVDVRSVAALRVFHRTRHRTQCGLVEHELDVPRRLGAGATVANVSLDESKAREGFVADARGDVVEIFLITGREVVQAHYLLVQAK